ncbi:hypothetical protein CIK05_11180 [Bdellovibrio sp. qaytius]|nr:hypothetical protein CIK05_11180 [Bdellovibrio sp. qaytius]
MTWKSLLIVFIFSSSQAMAIAKKQISQNEFNQLYEAEIKPLFAKSCFECHSQNNELPWFHNLPVIKEIMDEHIAQAQKHLDLTHGFKNYKADQIQFKLDLIAHTVRNDLMPPKSYRLTHRVALTEQDKAAIENWIAKSRSLLTLN